MTEILLYGTIGQDFWDFEDAITAKSVMDQLPESGPVTVRISSGGGDVYEGIDIMNALRGHDGEITVIVESLAASAASFIAVGAADRLVMRDESEMMIHKAWTWLDGNADQVRRKLADLDRQDVKIAQIYADRAGGEVDEWLNRMSDETWYTSTEALDAGLIDAIESARKPVTPSARVPNRVFAQFKYANRSEAPPPPIVSRSESGSEKTTQPSDGQNGDKMNVLNQLAQDLGMKPEKLRNALSGFSNEIVPISGEVEVTYPTDVKIVPTEKIKVDPIIGDKAAADTGADTSADPAGEPVAAVEEPAGDSAAVQLAKSAGLTFEMGTVADGFTAEVDEGGVVTIKAPSGAEVGSTADFTVKVNGTDVALTITVRGLDEEDTGAGTGEDTNPGDVPPTAMASIPKGFTLVPQAHLNDLTERAKFANSAFEKQKVTDREAEVDKWIKEGRFSAGNRETVLAQHKNDPELARQTWGQLPKNSIPRAEQGYGKSSVADAGAGAKEDKVAAAIERANHLASAKK